MFKDKYFLKHLIGWTLASMAIMFFSFYSFAPLSKDQLLAVETTVVMAEAKHDHRVRWVNFYDENSNKYYCHDDMLKSFESTHAFADILQKEYKGKTLTIYYTTRMDLTPFNIPRFIGFNRVTAIECGDEVLTSLDTYNSVNSGILAVWLIIAVIVLLFATGPFLIYRIMEISANRKNKDMNP